MEGYTTYKLQRNPKQNLLPPPPYCRKFEVDDDNNKEDTKGKRLEVSDPGKILLLTESLFDNNTLELEKKINAYVQSETDAQTVFIVTLVSISEEAVVQVIGQDVLEPEFRISIASHIFKQAVSKRNSIVTSLEDFDDNLRSILEQVLTQEKQESIPCEVITVPVLSRLKRGKVSALPILVCVINSPRPQEFITKIINETYRFCLPILLNTSKLEEEARIKRQCQSLLHVARKLFGHLGDLSDLLREIMSEARRLTNAERCSLFLLDPDHIHLVAKVFDGMVHDNVETEVRIARDQGIAGHVAATGKLLNIKDAYTHPLFYKGMDEATGFKTRNILCFPIRDEQGIIGVAQLCNKVNGDFDFFDEEVALAFSIYCGLSIMHTLVYKKIQEAQNRSKLSNELMLYHMKVSEKDVNQIMLCTNRHAYLDYDCFHFSPKRVRFTETPCQILRMFEDFRFFQYFRIKREALIRFVLYVQKGYRDTPYHNWMHAFSVTHFAYVVMRNLNLVENGYLTNLEALAYMISCMCHDIDHRGTTNSFQLQSESVLANLYSSEGSVMEHHHLSQSLCILNTEDCNFLDALGNSEYVQCLALMKDMILATDLANHFKLEEKQRAVLEEGFNSNNKDHKYVFICLLMTCADLSDQIKDWLVVRKVAQTIYEEFFLQGDMEKSMGKTPATMMDREKASIPNLQIDFLEKVCLPVYQILADIFPNATSLVETIKLNLKCWEACKPIFENASAKGLSSMDTLMSREVEEINLTVLAAEKAEDEAKTKADAEQSIEEQTQENSTEQKEKIEAEQGGGDKEKLDVDKAKAVDVQGETDKEHQVDVPSES